MHFYAAFRDFELKKPKTDDDFIFRTYPIISKRKTLAKQKKREKRHMFIHKKSRHFFFLHRKLRQTKFYSGNIYKKHAGRSNGVLFRLSSCREIG